MDNIEDLYNKLYCFVPETNKVLSLPIETQYFPFLPTFMKYILQNLSPKLLLKLYQCCKYFYFKSKITIAENVWFYNDSKDTKIEFTFNEKNTGKYFCRIYPKIQNLWLTDKLHISFPCGPSFNYGKIGNELLKKIYRNNLKKLSIRSGFTLFKELEILSESPNLTKIDLSTFVKNENDEPIPIEEIMVLFPNIKKFEISPSYFTMESFQKFFKFKFSNIFQRIRFGMIKNEFDPTTFCNFLKGNCDEETRFSVSFDSYDLQLRLLHRVKELIKGWETKNLKYFLL